ncbi:MAG: hypothetical protein JWM28_4108 [Chitinophagaceae bacterium]|nr:hypothetical protein [Chitinophagaceae bacterium]
MHFSSFAKNQIISHLKKGGFDVGPFNIHQCFARTTKGNISSVVTSNPDFGIVVFQTCG